MAYNVASYAKKYRIPIGLAQALIGRESGHRPGAVSPAGATGLTQVMPSTAAGMFGISEAEARRRLKNPDFALEAGFRYLAHQKQTFKTWRLALAAYNAGPNAVLKYHGVPPYGETQRYVRAILAKAGVLTTSTGPRAPANTTSAPAASTFDPRALASESLSDISRGQYDPLEELYRLHQSMLENSSQKGTGAPLSPSGGKGKPASPPQGDWSKYVVLGKGADRAGVHTQEAVLQFVGQLGLRLGRKLTIGTGTNHNQMTVNGNVSAHWDGNAADIPASGKQLTLMGRQALIAAGMDSKEARKAKGGIYNVGGYQIIFNTREGGNHWNHLHIGIRSHK